MSIEKQSHAGKRDAGTAICIHTCNHTYATSACVFMHSLRCWEVIMHSLRCWEVRGATALHAVRARLAFVSDKSMKLRIGTEKR